MKTYIITYDATTEGKIKKSIEIEAPNNGKALMKFVFATGKTVRDIITIEEVK